MAGLPWFKVYAAEMLSDERFLEWTIDERGAWFTLIAMCWREGSVPADPDRLARLLKVDSSRMALLWAAISSRFATLEGRPDRITSPRLEQERQEVEAAIEAKASAGKKGAKARWGKKKPKNGTANGSAIADAKRPECKIQTRSRQDPDQSQTPDSQRDGGGDQLESVREKLARALGLPRIGIGRDPERVLPSFQRLLDLGVTEDDLVAECVRLAHEKGITPGHLSWWTGWLDTVPDSKLPTGGAT